MKSIRFITLMLILCTILSSCRSVYIDPEKELSKDSNTGSEKGTEVDTEEEYFTDGSVYKQGNPYDGFFYEGCWIYVERQETIGPRGLLVRDGKEYVKYGGVTMQRIVKFNPATGVTSSVCLDPVCNHSYESGCPVLVPLQAGNAMATPQIFIKRIVGDWLIFYFIYDDAEYNARITTTAYNLKTGESRSMLEENLSDEVMTRWGSGCFFEEKHYVVKQLLDYSETGYKPGGEGEKVLDYTPKTKQIIWEINLETGKEKELFEIPELYKLAAVSNKRFFLFDSNANVMYSCNRDGSNMQKMEGMDSPPSNLVGTRAYWLEDTDNSFSYFDLKTNEKKRVTIDFSLYKLCALADQGILFDHLTSYDAFNEMRAKKNEYIEEYCKTMSEPEARSLFNEELNNLLYSGTAKIYMSDFDGSNMRLIYEAPFETIESLYAQGDYVFVRRLRPREAFYSVINTKTGEVINPPLLDIVTPDWYVTTSYVPKGD